MNMSYINLNSDSDYSSIGLFPVAQQVLGIGTVLKNIIGLIKDIFVKIFSCGKEEKPFSIEDDSHYKVIQAQVKCIDGWDNWMEEVKLKRHDNTISFTELNKMAEEMTDLINRMSEEYNLRPLSEERRLHYQTLPEENFFDQYSKWTAELREKLENKKEEIKKSNTPYNLFEVMPFSERMQNIALGIITTIPGVASVYHCALLHFDR